MNYENYTKTEDANGVITFTPKPKPVPDGAYWEPKEGEEYFFYYGDGSVCSAKNQGYKTDENFIQISNCFRTKELAEKHVEYLKALTRVRKYIAENGLYWEPDWSNRDQIKYFLMFDFRSNTFESDWAHNLKRFSPIDYFKSIEDAKKVIKACNADLRIIWDVK